MNGSLTGYRSLLDTYLRPQHRRVALLTALLFGGIGLQLLNPQVIRYFIDTTQSGGAQDTLLPAALLFIIVGLAQRGMALGSVYVGENVAWTATNALRADLARHCLGLDMSFHKRHTPGELIERIDGDVTALANFFSQFAIRVLGNALLIIAVLALLFHEDWRVGLGLVAYTLVTLFALGALQNLAVARWAAERQASADQFGFLEERFSGTEDIRASGAEVYVLQRLYHLMRDVMLRTRSAQLLSNLTFVSTNSLFVIGYALGLAVGAYLYSQGEVSIGTAYLMVFYIGMLSAPLENIRSQVEDLQQAGASVGRIQWLRGLRARVQDHNRHSLTHGPLALAFEGVSFAYADEPPIENGQQLDGLDSAPSPVLHNISFQLEAGRVLGLLGRTGSGKSTLTRLIVRLYDPTSGAVRLGGLDLRTLGLGDLRGRVGVVTQDVQLFQASIRDNLTFFNPRIDDAHICAALDQLGLGEWLRTLPAGLDTQLGAGGQGLSAGETQLLAFTRVLLRDPGLVILDEASSRLDPATERLLDRAIAGLLQGRTGIIIAHRLSSVQRADRIMILEQGRIVEDGIRGRLARDPESRFAMLLQTGLEEALV